MFNLKRLRFSVVWLRVVVLFVAAGGLSAQGDVIGISIPIGSDDAISHPILDNVWSVNAPPFPFNIELGIGFIINPALKPGLGSLDFSRHDHVYDAPNIPDPARAVVTYQFDTPTVVDQIEIIQHTNGITRIEGFAGNSLASLVSVGSVFGPSGDVTGNSVFVDGSSQVFDLNNSVSGSFFRFVVTKTSLPNGWATYRAFPRLEDGSRIAGAVPEPTSLLVWLALGLCTTVAGRWRERP